MGKAYHIKGLALLYLWYKDLSLLYGSGNDNREKAHINKRIKQGRIRF